MSKTVKNSYSYTPFGELLSGSTAKTTFFAYNGESYDSATGMVNLRARWYEPSTMRFSQRDIIRGFTLIPSTQNRYAYCLNNPILFTDPSGEFVLAALLIGAAIGAIIGGVSSYKAQKAATGKVDVWKVAKDALIGGVVGGVVGVVGAAVAGALATAVGATTLTATGLTTTLTLAQSVGVMSVSAVAAGTVARATNAAVRNSFTNEPKRDVAKEAFNPKAMTTDAVVGGISGVATYYSTGGVYSTTSIDRRYGGSTTPTSTKPTQGDKPNGSTSGDNPLDDAVRNASGEYAGEQYGGATQGESAGTTACTEAGQIADDVAQQASEAASNIGKNYGKIGTVVENPGLNTTGFSEHAINQAITRGVTTRALLDTVRDPAVVLSQRGGNSFIYISENAAVVLNNAGEIITTYSSQYFDDTIQKILMEALH